MSIFEFKDYKEYLLKWIASQRKKGYGVGRKISEFTKLSPAMLSHILSGDKHFSLEAAMDVTVFLGLNESETDYFLLLVNYARAGSHSLRKTYGNKVISEQKRNNELGNKVNPNTELSETAKTLFYSQWLYSGIRNMSACPQFSNVDKIADHLHLPRSVVQRTVEFLLQNRLCVMNNNLLGSGPSRTHVGNDTSLVNKHHQNWRIHGLTKMVEQNDKHLFYTSPMSMSLDVADEIRNKIPSFVEQIIKLVGPSESEVVRCLNIDWFDF